MTAREAQREYMRQWRQRNPEKVKRNQENFWKRQAEKMTAQRLGGGDNLNEK